MASTFLDIRITLALSFSLALMAAMMVVLVAIVTRRYKRPTLEEKHLKGFKGDTLSARIRLHSGTKRRRIHWVTLRAFSVVAGMKESSALIRDDDTLTVTLVTGYAGRFTGLRLRLEFTDPLELFSSVREIEYEDFIVDVLPSSLLRPTSVRRSGMLTTGETPAGFPGLGQELFSIDEYQPFTDTKHIIWKRVARSSQQNLYVRVRESDVPSLIRIGLLDSAQRGEEERVIWMDLLCEGVCLLAKELIDIGSSVELLYQSSTGLIAQRVSSLHELADALMSFSGSSASGGGFTPQLIDRADVVATGLKEVEKVEIARGLSNKPSLLINETASPIFVGEPSVVFSGGESIFPLVARVIERG